LAEGGEASPKSSLRRVLEEDIWLAINMTSGGGENARNKKAGL